MLLNVFVDRTVDFSATDSCLQNVSSNLEIDVNISRCDIRSPFHIKQLREWIIKKYPRGTKAVFIYNNSDGILHGIASGVGDCVAVINIQHFYEMLPQLFVHEWGHLLGATHCNNICVMSEDIRKFDQNKLFCDSCYGMVSKYVRSKD